MRWNDDSGVEAWAAAAVDNQAVFNEQIDHNFLLTGK